MRLPVWGLCVLTACGSTHRVTLIHPSAEPPGAGPHALPPARPADTERYGELVRHSIVGPLQSLFNSPGMLRRLAGRRVEAYNVTATDDVAGDAWFVARMDDRRNEGDSDAPPDRSVPWTVTSIQRTSAIPVLMIRDGAGQAYWLTFDAPEFPELATGAAVIAARLYRAAGYLVPTVSLVRLDPEHDLVPADSVRDALASLPRDAAGRIRAAAHRVPGQPLGLFSFSGRRKDDPADSIPHEHRRELRGLYVVAAWLNHTGLFRGTTLDVGIERASPPVRHYLVGLESSLDAGFGGRPKLPRAGTESMWDTGKIASRALTLDFFAVSWERMRASAFDPGGWTPNLPNSAFGHRTTRDGYWGAKRVAEVSDVDIVAAVQAAQVSDSTRAHTLVAMLQARRQATLRYWYSLVTPLDGLSLRSDSLTTTLDFHDLAVSAGLGSAGPRTYHLRASWARGDATSDTTTLASDGRGTLRLSVWAACADGTFAGQPPNRGLGWIDVWADSAQAAGAARAVRLFVLCDNTRGKYRIAGYRY